jgi:hypothetical protein
MAPTYLHHDQYVVAIPSLHNLAIREEVCGDGLCRYLVAAWGHVDKLALVGATSRPTVTLPCPPRLSGPLRLCACQGRRCNIPRLIA